MDNFTLVRVDHRLIHGQVITKWVKIANASKILIVDDFLGQDAFMADIYKMAAPNGIEVQILTSQEASDAYKNNNLGDKKTFLLFKNVEMAYKAYKQGLIFNTLQLGGIPNDGKKKMVFTAVSLGNNDVEQLTELEECGLKIELQIVPEEASMSFDTAMKKYNN